MTTSTPAKKKTPAVPTIRTQRILALILLLAHGGITVTGSIVRVTGSGLGCETWPACHEDSLVPVPGASPGIHQAIEFGNRLLTFVVMAAAIAVFVALIKAKRRRELIVYSLIAGLGVLVQAVIGGISVHVNLHWWAVALHFLPSMILVWVSALLFMRVAEPDDAGAVRGYPRAAQALAVLSAVMLSIVLITGTMTTGAGPHGGDATIAAEDRLQVDIDLMAHIHGYSMWVYLAATVALVIYLYAKRAEPRSLHIGIGLIAAILVQAAIGILQYRLGVPRWSIPLHVAMCSVVVAFTAILYSRGVVRAGGEATTTGSPEGDRRRLEREAA